MENEKLPPSEAEKSLLESKQRLERMANTVPVMLYDSVLGPDGTSRFLYVAPKPCREILELDPEALLMDMGLVWNLVHPEDLGRFHKEDVTANRERKEFTSEVRIITPSGRLKWLQVHSKPNPAGPGEPVVWSGFLQDITARKQAVEQLRETEQTLRVIVEQSTNLFYIHTSEHVFTYVSPQSRQFFDCEPEELLGRWAELLTDHPQNQTAVAATQTAIDSGCRQAPYQVECVGKKGRKIWVEVNEAPILEQGRTVAIAGSLTDITERKQAELEREQYFNFFQTSADLMCIADPQGTFLKTNPAFTEALGYSEQELLSRPLLEFIHPDDRQATLEEIHRQNQRGYTDNFENRYVCKDGSLKWLSWRVNFNKAEGLAYATARDISGQKAVAETLRASRNLLQSVLETVPIRVFWKDIDSNYLGCNPAFARDAGFSRPEELVGKNDFQMGWRDHAELYRADDRRVMASGLPLIGIEEPLTTPDGSTIWLNTSKVPLFDSADRVVGVLGIYEDITERKQAADALRESEEQLRGIFETSQAGIILVDPRGTIQFANNRMAEMFGWSLGQLIGSSYVEHLHETERQTGDERMRRLIRGDLQSVAVERHFLRADGSDFWGFLSGRRLENPDGTLRSLVGIIADITERKLAEDALRESENRLRFALEGTNDGLWDVEMKTGATYLSPRGCEILGYQSNEVGAVAKVWSDLVHPDDLPLTHERLREHIEGRTPIFEVDQRLRMKSGLWKWVLTRGKVVSRDQEGVPLRMTGTHTDLTEQRKLQEQLSHAQKLESVGRLAGGVAHDFNNMLSVILGHAEMAQKRGAISPPVQEHLTQIQKAAERSSDIVRQLLAFARKQTIAPEVLDLNETVNSMLRMLGRLIGEEIDLVWRPEKVYPVKLDPAQVDQILANLCINAKDAIAGVGRITIGTENKHCDALFCASHTGLVPGDYVLLTVSDDGCGMNQETRKMIFEPFFTTKGVGQGTGLGLATVYGIVKQNGGFIDVYSEPGYGTSFKIYLPRYLGTEGPARTAEPLASIEGGKETILLVEDEPAILDVGTQLLEMQGYRVLAAGSPGEAIRLAAEHRGEIHLLMTDVVMPEMNGRELARKLLSLYPGLKCLFMSGYTANVIAHHGVLDEGVHFIQKPFSLNTLTLKVREVLTVP